jgi:two-component system, NarL family, response regulator DegU
VGPIKLVIADDHALFREGLRRIFSMEKDILVVGEASSGDEAVSIVERMRPDILLLDLKMPKGDALQSLARINAKSPATKVMILTAYSETENVLDTAKAHARGYILKGVSSPTLLQAIRKVHAGEIWVDRELPASVDFQRIASGQSLDAGPPANETLQSLTKRELEILHLVAEGLSNDEIAKKIFISEKTVKTHLTNIFDKLQVHNRFKAALLIMHQPTAPTAFR